MFIEDVGHYGTSVAPASDRGRRGEGRTDDRVGEGVQCGHRHGEVARRLGDVRDVGAEMCDQAGLTHLARVDTPGVMGGGSFREGRVVPRDGPESCGFRGVSHLVEPGEDWVFGARLSRLMVAEEKTEGRR
jgi:hypothetical protein